MKKILCYGDSNTWGQIPHEETRMESDKIWTVVLQRLLGEGYEVIQAGLCARVAGSFDSEKPYRNGQLSYEVVYRTAEPIDCVVIALGTNDLKAGYNRRARQIADDLLWYKRKTLAVVNDLQRPVPQFIYLAPPPFRPSEYFDGVQSARKELLELLRSSADNLIVSEDLALSSDGVHLSEQGHKQEADKVHEKVKELRV